MQSSGHACTDPRADGRFAPADDDRTVGILLANGADRTVITKATDGARTDVLSGAGG